MSRSYFQMVLRYPWMVILASIIMVLGIASGAKHISFSNDYRMFFGEENPQLQAFEALQNTYSKNDNVLFVLTPKDGNVFTPSTLDAVEWLTNESWQVPFSSRVDSISNFQYSSADGDDLWVRDLVEGAADLSIDEIKTIKAIALAEPLLLNRLISPSGDVTGVNVTVQLPAKNMNENPITAKFSRELAEKFSHKYPDIEIRQTGMVVMNNAFPEASMGDMKTLYPAMFGIILVVLAFLLRSFVGMFVTAIIIIFTIMITMGMTGWVGIQMSPPTTSVPIAVMTLAVADCVHVLIIFVAGMRSGLSKIEAMHESLRVNLAPIFLTTLTTAIGFLSLNFSDAPPFRDLGNMAAMGIVGAFVLSMTLLPALTILLPINVKKREDKAPESMSALSDFVITYHKRLFWGFAGIGLVLLALVPRNDLNDIFVNYFDESIQFRADTDYTAERLTGIYLIEYSLPAPGPGMVSDPEFLNHLENFANWYRQQENVLHVNAITDIMKRLNKNLHGDDPNWYKLPDNQELSAQYLLLYEFSLPFGLDLTNQINLDKSATRLVVTMKTVSTEELLLMERNAQAWLKENAPESMRSHGVSASVMFANIGHRNIRSMAVGTFIALMLISAILVVALRSWRLGLLSIVPNILPIGMALGIWAIFVGEVGLALSVVSGTTLGIVVDDTVHFLSKYLRAQREQGLSSEQAVRYAFSTVGPALWVTSLVLVIGFLILSLSNFQLNAGMGLLTAITIALALVADFLFLPALLMKYGEKNETSSS